MRDNNRCVPKLEQIFQDICTPCGEGHVPEPANMIEMPQPYLEPQNVNMPIPEVKYRE